MKYTKENLVDICRRAVVPAEKWSNRDSACAQNQVGIIYNLLKSGADYELEVYDESIHIKFPKLTQDQINYFEFDLGIDSLSAYRDLFGYEDEMFTPCEDLEEGGRWSGYLPTEQRLIRYSDEDWY